MAASARASDKWDKWNEEDQAKQWVNWWTSPKCNAYYNAQICGRPVPGSSEGCRVRLADAAKGRKLELGVSVGCGAASKEMAFLQDEIVERFELWEIAPKLAETGRQAAERLGLLDRIDYRVGDAFGQSVTPRFDLVYWDHSLHHMSDVSKALEWSVASLKPGGFVVINDYVGPNRLQFTRQEVDLANDFLARNGFTDRHQKSNLITRLRQWWRDPSEAPQSEMIPEAIKRNLPGAELEPIGGTFLNMLGGRVAPLGEDSSQIDALIREDGEMKERGFHHFAFAIWQKAEA
jgi:SAM-dependent methyltransferase